MRSITAFFPVEAALIAICVSLPARAFAQEVSAATSRQLTIAARAVLNPGSTCDLPKPPPPVEITFQPGARTEMRGCLDLDSTRLFPVAVTIRRRDPGPVLALRLPAPASVWLASGRDSSAALALWLRVAGRGGYVTDLSGLDVPIAVGDSLGLLFLFPAGAPGGRLTVGQLGRAIVASR